MTKSNSRQKQKKKLLQHTMRKEGRPPPPLITFTRPDVEVIAKTLKQIYKAKLVI